MHWPALHLHEHISTASTLVSPTDRCTYDMLSSRCHPAVLQSPFFKSQPIFLRAARAQGLWLEDPAQVVGTPDNVLKALTYAGFDASLVKVSHCSID